MITPVENFLQALDRAGFLQVRETLTRIGILSLNTSTLWQSCHILHKRGRYFVVHFKQMFALDGKLDKDEISDEDLDRLERVAVLLESWGMIKPLVELDNEVRSVVNVVPHKDKARYQLKAKYTMGAKRTHEHNRDTNATGH